MLREMIQISWDIITLNTPVYLNFWILIIYILSVLEGIFTSIQKGRPLIRVIVYALIERLILTIIAITVIGFILRVINLLLPGHIQPYNQNNLVLLSLMIITTSIVLDFIIRVIVKNKHLNIILVVVIMGVVVSIGCLWGLTLIFNPVISLSFVVILLISVILTLFLTITYCSR